MTSFTALHGAFLRLMSDFVDEQYALRVFEGFILSLKYSNICYAVVQAKR